MTIETQRILISIAFGVLGFAISIYTDGTSKIGICRINWRDLGILPLYPTYGPDPIFIIELMLGKMN